MVLLQLWRRSTQASTAGKALCGSAKAKAGTSAKAEAGTNSLIVGGRRRIRGDASSDALQGRTRPIHRCLCHRCLCHSLVGLSHSGATCRMATVWKESGPQVAGFQKSALL